MGPLCGALLDLNSLCSVVLGDVLFGESWEALRRVWESDASQSVLKVSHSLHTLVLLLCNGALRSRGMVGCDGLLATGWPVCCYPRHRWVSWAGC